jgi:hypothetical protein
VLPVPRSCNSADKVYRSLLDACIEGIEKFPVDRRQQSRGTCTSFLRLSACLPLTDCKFLIATAQPNNNTTAATTAYIVDIQNLERATTPPLQQTCATSLISPPHTPRHSISPTRSVAFDATMNRGPLHGAPVRSQAPPPRGPARGAPRAYGNQDVRGNAQPAYGNQDARGNFAVQPAAATGTFKLKKAAVRVIGAAGSTPSAPAVGSSPVPGPVKAKPEEVKRYVLPITST